MGVGQNSSTTCVNVTLTRRHPSPSEWRNKQSKHVVLVVDGDVGRIGPAPSVTVSCLPAAQWGRNLASMAARPNPRAIFRKAFLIMLLLMRPWPWPPTTSRCPWSANATPTMNRTRTDGGTGAYFH